ncbi:MAG: type II toxin-antitoxin system RelB/DinJ family antitoxin [Candidatus Paceibacterota bacterium]|jgi:addiction module RelB/DinJ family antitoxin
MNTTIQIRIDQTTKSRAQKAFKNMGLDLSSGIKYLLTQAGKANSLSYICDFGYLHNYNSEKVKELREEIDYAKKHAKRFSSVKEMFDDLEK